MTDVIMQTSAGEIRIRLFTGEAPDTTANFLRLVDDGYYNGLHFHRVIEQFMICLLYTSPSPRDRTRSRMPSSA